MQRQCDGSDSQAHPATYTETCAKDVGNNICQSLAGMGLMNSGVFPPSGLSENSTCSSNVKWTKQIYTNAGYRKCTKMLLSYSHFAAWYRHTPPTKQTPFFVLQLHAECRHLRGHGRVTDSPPHFSSAPLDSPPHFSSASWTHRPTLKPPL